MKINLKMPPIHRFNVIISIVLALVAWIFVVYNYSPMKTVTYTGVPIEYVGEEDIVQRGLAIQKSTADYVDVTLNINRMDFNEISAEDISVTADVSRVVEGTNGISLSVTPPEECEFIKTSTNTVSVEVTSSTNKDVDITPVYRDSSDSAIEPVASQMSYRKVSVYGTEENVAKVKCAAVQFSVNDLESTEKMFIISPVALDENGNEVHHVVVLPGEISVHAFAGSVRKVALDVITNDSSGQDNRSCDYPKSIYVKGSVEVLDSIESITTRVVDITNVNESEDIPLAYVLPDGVYLARRSIGEVLSVTVKQ